MTDVSFVSTKFYPSGEFALQRVLWAGYGLGRKALSWVYHPPRASVPGLPPVGRALGNEKNIPRIHGETQVMLALPLGAPFHFATSLGGRSTSMFSFNEFEMPRLILNDEFWSKLEKILVSRSDLWV